MLFALDRATFNNIVKESAVKKREKFEATLSKIELLSQLSPYERGHISDGVKEDFAKAGDYVIRQGDEGNTFFMIVEGELQAT